MGQEQDELRRAVAAEDLGRGATDFPAEGGFQKPAVGIAVTMYLRQNPG
jgi:hypothetical protein